MGKNNCLEYLTTIPAFQISLFFPFYIVSQFTDIVIIKVLLIIALFYLLLHLIRIQYNINKLFNLFPNSDKKFTLNLRSPMGRLQRVDGYSIITFLLTGFMLYNIYNNNLFWTITLFIINHIWAVLFSLICKNHLNDISHFK